MGFPAHSGPSGAVSHSSTPSSEPWDLGLSHLAYLGVSARDPIPKPGLSSRFCPESRGHCRHCPWLSVGLGTAGWPSPPVHLLPEAVSRKDLCEKAAPADLGSCAYSARKKDADFDPSSDTTAIARQKPAAEPPPSQGPTSHQPQFGFLSRWQPVDCSGSHPGMTKAAGHSPRRVLAQQHGAYYD